MLDGQGGGLFESEGFVGSTKSDVKPMQSQCVCPRHGPPRRMSGDPLSLAPLFCKNLFIRRSRCAPDRTWICCRSSPLFWRRPRLHAWWELMRYERAAKEAEVSVAAMLEAVDFSSIALDVPTSQLRTFPKHAL